MIKVSVLYPAGAGKKFNMEYYLGTHMPMVRSKLGAACKSTAVEQGLGGGAPRCPADLHRDGASLFRFRCGIPGRVRPAC